MGLVPLAASNGIWRKRKIEGGEMYFAGQDCGLVYFLWGFFFVFCFLYNNTEYRSSICFVISPLFF